MSETVGFLLRPAHYPEGTASVSLLETHFSYVFLTDRYVYKLKKPQRYSLVDLSTAAARRENCLEEVRLNRRLARHVYLGVVALTRGGDGALALDGPGEPVDYLVRMHRLEAALCLEWQLLHGGAAASELDCAAGRLAAFYAENAPTGMVDPAARRFRFHKQATELRELLGDGAAEPLRDTLCHWLDHHHHALAGRCVREVHGDLRPEHIYLGADPCMIDRLEFEPGLRQMDPLEELAFLVLECDRLGQRWAGERFRAYYLETSGDEPPLGLCAFYEAARALLWALLGARHLVTQPDKARHWRQRAQWYLDAGLRAVGRGV
ncbi:hypothetical protein [Aquisalimonas sp.]|uniref:hypothetical protein n=1 Tax=unclassified Aquisalimonas TaxID=2644645 RepID=UPI0025BD15D2|nr:hypothetical protein [Aquisalimonas sp.]